VGMGASKTRRLCGELCDKVSAAPRVTETPGSCTIHSEEYDVNEGASGEDDSE